MRMSKADWPKATFEGEVYQFLTTCFDIDAALEIVKGREPVMVDMTGAYQGLVFNRVDKEHAKTVDLDKPILIADIASTTDTPDQPCYMPIDGWHRIWRGHHEGREALPAIVMTSEETDHIMRR